MTIRSECKCNDTRRIILSYPNIMHKSIPSNNKHVYPTALRDGPTNNCFHHSTHLYKEQIILNTVYAPTTEFYFPHT